MLTSLFDALGRTVARRPLTTVTVWAVLAVAGFLTATTGLGGPGLLDRVTVAEPAAPGSDSAAADAILAGAGAGGASASLVVRGVDPADEAVVATMGTLSTQLAELDGVAAVVNPYVLDGGPANPAARDLVSADGDGFVTYVLLEGDAAAEAGQGTGGENTDDGSTNDESTGGRTAAAAAARAVAHDAVVDRLEAVPAALRRDSGEAAAAASGLVTSTELVNDAVREQAGDDLRTGTLLALPLALVVAALALGGLLAAAVPLAAAVAALGTGLGALYLLTVLPGLSMSGQSTAVDVSVPAVVAMVTVGVTLGNALFLTARFQEELAGLSGLTAESPLLRRRRRGGVVVEAVARTMATAGRAVTLSSLVVVAAAAGLLVLSPAVVRGAGAGTLAAATVALLTAVTLVPALLALTARHLARPGLLRPAATPRPRRQHGPAHDRAAHDRLASPRRALVRFVRRRRWGVAVGCLAVLLGLAAPAVALQVRATGAIERLPDDAEQRRFVETLVASYPASEGAEVTVLARATPADVEPLAARIGGLDGVSRTGEPSPLEPVAGTAAGSDGYSGGYTVLGVHTAGGAPTGREAQDVVRAVRDLDAPYEVLVTGQAATQVDLAASLARGGALAAVAVAVVAALLAFLATGSVPVAAMSVASGALTLVVSLGVLVAGFQWGALTVPLRVAAVGGIEANVLATVAALAFGLGCARTMLVTSRVAELRAGGTSGSEAVRRGLHRTGRWVLAAVLVVVVVQAAFLAGGGLVIKETGLAVAVAALVDLVVLALLWPAALALLGRRAWWAPRAMREGYARLR